MGDNKNLKNKYSFAHYLWISDIFPKKWDYKYIKGSENFIKKNRCNSKAQLARKIFFKFLRMVLDDMIDNKVCFVFPTRVSSWMRVEEMEDKWAKKCRQRGVYQNVDLLKTDFKLCHVVYKMKDRPKRNVRIHHDDYERIVDKMNQGEKYYPCTLNM